MHAIKRCLAYKLPKKKKYIMASQRSVKIIPNIFRIRYLRSVGTLVQQSTRVCALPSFHARSSWSTFPQQSLASAMYSSIPPRKKVKVVNITFIDRDGDEHTVEAKVGDTLLEVAKEYDIDLEGACEGTLSCSTCHLIVSPEWYSKIPDPITDEEDDMLDMAYGLTDTSRLGCQILVSEALEGLKLTVPTATRDARNT